MLCVSVEGSLAASVSEAVEKGARSLEKIEDFRRKGGLYNSVPTALCVCLCVCLSVELAYVRRHTLRNKASLVTGVSPASGVFTEACFDERKLYKTVSHYRL